MSNTMYMLQTEGYQTRTLTNKMRMFVGVLITIKSNYIPEHH